ncbi:MAG: EAL domain-containing protein, partial [Oscillospiraceae bacterium]
ISGIVRYNDSLVMHIVEERKIEQSMHVALREGEFQVYIQPKYKLSNAKFMGAEALIRWVSPSMGFLPPDKFIPIFEKNGFVEEIDFFVLETVMQKMCYFHSIGFEYFPVSVNMSRITIGNTNYINRLRDLFVKYPLPAGVVELEITETIFGDENKKMLGILEKMRDLGAVIVMDDFGSGYSSLNLLKEVPFDVLKIDREFMNESETSEKTRVILKSMIEMAQKIKVQVVCEGVETKEQVDFLNEINCDVAQGFYFARPMPFPKFEQELEKYGTKLEDANV